MIRLARVLVLSMLATLALCGPAAAVDRYVPMKVGPAPGPAKYDRVWVQQYGTDLSNGRVARGARRLARFSRITRPVVVDDERASHLDPTSAAPSRNRFLKTVVPFLRRIAR